MMVCSVQFEISEERRVLEIGIILAVGIERGMKLAVDIELQLVTIGKNCGVFSWAVRSCLTEVPIKIRNDYGTQVWAHVRLIEGCAELGNPEDVGNARILDAFVRVLGTTVFECTPRDHTAKARIGQRSIVRLSVVEGLLVLSRNVSCAAI